MNFTLIFKQKFEEIDKNKDGFLSPDELKPMLVKYGFQEQKVDEFMKMYDSNKDGKISKEEFLEGMERRIDKKDLNCATLRNQFRAIDKDNSGKLSRAELTQYLKKNPDFVFPMVLFDELDKNKDKQIDFDEFFDYVKDYM